MPDKSIVEVPCGIVVWAAVGFQPKVSVEYAYPALNAGKQVKTNYSGFDGEASFCPD
jgi:hypothetical protein